MSLKRSRIDIEPNPGSAEIGALTTAAKCVGNAPNNAGSVNQHQIEPNTLGTPIAIICENDFGGGDQASLLSIRQRECRIGKPGAGLDLHDCQETIFLRDQIDLTCRGSEPARKNAPTIAFQGQLGGLFGGTTSPVSVVPSTGAN
jgi:hypothetical protein